MPPASGSSRKVKTKEKGKKTKKGSKTASAPPENRPSPVVSPSLDPQMQQAGLEGEPIPSLPDSAHLTPEATEINLDQERPPSPQDPNLASTHQPYVEDETGQGEVAVSAASSPPLEDLQETWEIAREQPAEQHISDEPETQDLVEDTEKDIFQEIHEVVNSIDGKQDLSAEPEGITPEQPEQPEQSQQPEQPEQPRQSEEPEEQEQQLEPEQPAAPVQEPEPEQPRPKSFDEVEHTSNHSGPPPTQPIPIPLPSPSLTDARSVTSPPPDHRISHPGSPAYQAYSSPVYKYASPRMHPHSYSPYMMNFNGASPTMIPPGSVAPSSASFATAFHSPVMEHASIGSPYAAHYQKRSGSIATGARDYYHGGMERSMSNGHSHGNGHRMENGHGPVDDGHHDPVHLLTRIEKVMPDLSRLLHSYKDTQGKLSAREAEARQLEAQHEQALMHKDFYIEALQAQMKKAANETAEESSKLKNTISELRMELGNLQEKQKDMEENLAASRKENEELSQTKVDLEGEIENLQTKIKELQEAHEKAINEHAQALEEQKEAHQAALANQKEELTGLFEEIRAEDEKAANEKLEARERELFEEQESMKAAWTQEKQEMEEARAILETAHETAMNEKQSELDTRVAELSTTQADLETARQEIETKVGELESKQGELNVTKTDLEATKTELDSTKADLESTRSDLESTKSDLESRQTELESKITELEARQGELDTTKAELEAKQTELESKVAELESTHAELTTKQSELEDKQKELEEARQQHATELEKLAETHQGELDGLREAHATEIQDIRDSHATGVQSLRDTHSGELEGIRETHAIELSGLRNTHDEQMATATKVAEERLRTFMTELEEKEKQWTADRINLERQLIEKSDELDSLGREKEALERDDVAREKQLQTAVDEMRRTIDNMENDREKLRKTLQSLGEATDLKTSKGDLFFMESFGQLSRLIVELSKEHFAYLPIDPPKDILEKVPPEMPSFLDNTPASRELRSAYIQHVISKTLTYRIFQPFLFTLGRRYDKADTFFQVLSMDIRRKSVRREAFWRQQTLKAAYTTSDAKQSINVVAAVIVDEIVDHIKHFADPKQLDALLTGIRRIVKLAAETWRHARVERELVLATMPAPDSEGVSNEEWDEYTCGRMTENRDDNDPARHVLLRLFPRICREAAHEDFADDREKVNACTYAPGLVLFSNSPSVLARREELARKASESPASPASREGSRTSSRNSARKSPVLAN